MKTAGQNLIETQDLFMAYLCCLSYLFIHLFYKASIPPFLQVVPVEQSSYIGRIGLVQLSQTA